MDKKVAPHDDVLATVAGERARADAAHDGMLAHIEGLGRGLLQRKLKARLDRRAQGDGTVDAEPASASAAVERAQDSSGAPLPGPTRQKFEGSLGVDLSGVRVHTGDASAQAAESVSALAYTTGQDVHFGAGQFDPGSASGERLLAHEVVHTVQQRGGAGGHQNKLEVSQPGDSAEQEADSLADAMVAGTAVGTPREQASGIHREVAPGTPAAKGADGPQGAESEVGAEGDKKFGFLDKVKTTLGGTTVVSIGNEKVRVQSEAEELEAKQIIDFVKSEYGVEISSTKTVEAIKAQYDKVPDKVKESLTTKTWEMKELRAIKAALAHYAAILGKKRDESSRKDDAQEVTSVGAVEQAIDTNTSGGKLDKTTLGEYFKGSKNFGMFKAGTNSTVDFKDNLKQLEGTIVHEMAHGLMANEYDNFVAKGSDGFWLDQNTKSGASGAEEPPSKYGNKNAREDLCESVMFFFVQESTLLSKCPKRHAFIKAVTDGWSAKKEVGKKEDGGKDEAPEVKKGGGGGCEKG